MKKLRKLKSALKNERGQGMLEYVMVLAIVVAIVLIFKNSIVSWFGQKTSDVQNKAEDVFK